MRLPCAEGWMCGWLTYEREGRVGYLSARAVRINEAAWSNHELLECMICFVS